MIRSSAVAEKPRDALHRLLLWSATFTWIDLIQFSSPKTASHNSPLPSPQGPDPCHFSNTRMTWSIARPVCYSWASCTSVSSITSIQLLIPFLPRDAMHKCGQCSHAVSVRPSRSWILSKRINISSKPFTNRQPHHSSFSIPNVMAIFRRATPPPNGSIECSSRRKARFSSRGGAPIGAGGSWPPTFRGKGGRGGHNLGIIH